MQENFQKYYIEVLKKYYMEFNGRSRRKEYWMFFLFSIIVSIVFSILDSILGFKGMNNVGVLNSLYSLAILLPSLGIAVRRLHDTNHSGWWLLVGLIPIVGIIVLLVFMVKDSDPGDNRYGSNPKGVSSTPVPTATTV